MSDLKKLGMNIRCLREAYGESQEELGLVIGVGKNTISYYESGQREPKKETLIKIARHYMVPIESLLYGSFTNNERLKIDQECLFNQIDILLPIVTSEKAMQNVSFQKAYNVHKNFYNACKKNGIGGMDSFDGNIEEYYLKAEEDANIKEEIAANRLALYLLMFMFLKNIPFFVNEKPAAINQLSDDIRKEIEYYDEAEDPELNDIINDISSDETKQMVRDLMITLKQSKRWCDLAYYYLALQYCYNLVDNSMDYGSNMRVGYEMMSSFVKLNNTYAVEFQEMCFRGVLPKSSSQSVDDK